MSNNTKYDFPCGSSIKNNKKNIYRHLKTKKHMNWMDEHDEHDETKEEEDLKEVEFKCETFDMGTISTTEFPQGEDFDFHPDVYRVLSTKKPNIVRRSTILDSVFCYDVISVIESFTGVFTKCGCGKYVLSSQLWCNVMGGVFWGCMHCNKFGGCRREWDFHKHLLYKPDGANAENFISTIHETYDLCRGKNCFVWCRNDNPYFVRYSRCEKCVKSNMTYISEINYYIHLWNLFEGVNGETPRNIAFINQKYRPNAYRYLQCYTKQNVKDMLQNLYGVKLKYYTKTSFHTIMYYIQNQLTFENITFSRNVFRTKYSCID